MYQVFQLSDDGFEMSLGYFPTYEDADNALEEFWNWRPHAYIDIREVPSGN